MAIPASITTALATLKTATKAAAPLNFASRATIVALQSRAEMLETSIQSTIPNAAGTLDGPELSGMAPVIVTQFQALFAYASEQASLVDMLGFVGRAATNLNQIGV